MLSKFVLVCATLLISVFVSFGYWACLALALLLYASIAALLHAAHHDQHLPDHKPHVDDKPRVSKSGKFHCVAGVPDHDPASLLDVDLKGEVMKRVRGKIVQDMSVFERCVVLQTGMYALKRNSLGRCATRWVWLTPKCNLLQWSTKKNHRETNEVRVDDLAKVRLAGQEVITD